MQIAGHRKTDREQGVLRKKGSNGDGAANQGKGRRGKKLQETRKVWIKRAGNGDDTVQRGGKGDDTTEIRKEWGRLETSMNITYHQSRTVRLKRVGEPGW